MCVRKQQADVLLGVGVGVGAGGSCSRLGNSFPFQGNTAGPAGLLVTEGFTSVTVSQGARLCHFKSGPGSSRFPWASCTWTLGGGPVCSRD